MLKLILPAVVSFALFTSCGETVTADDTAKHECTDECAEKCKKMGCDANVKGNANTRPVRKDIPVIQNAKKAVARKKWATQNLQNQK